MMPQLVSLVLQIGDLRLFDRKIGADRSVLQVGFDARTEGCHSIGERIQIPKNVLPTCRSASPCRRLILQPMAAKGCRPTTGMTFSAIHLLMPVSAYPPIPPPQLILTQLLVAYLMARMPPNQQHSQQDRAKDSQNQWVYQIAGDSGQE